MKNLKKIILYLILILFILPLAAHSKMYIWTDENGVKHVSNTAPPQNIKDIQQKGEKTFDEEKHQRLMEERESAEKEVAKEVEENRIKILENERQAKEKRQQRDRFNKVENGMSKAEVLQLCGHPDLREVSQQWNFGGAGAFDTDWTYFLDNNKTVVVRFRTWAGKSKVKKIINK